MAVAVKKYNPGFLSDEEIVESFCVRTSEFESIIECLRETTGNSNSHSLVIGPRGIGKTHLLLRVAAEVRRDETLACLFPIVFPEESYEVSTCGEFWFECIAHLVEQAPAGERDSLLLTHNDLRTVQDDQDLADRCIGALLDFADRHQKRLLLIVENLNMLFSDMGDPDAGWRLRKTLQTEPRVILLGSATSRFDEIDNPEHALYDLFRVVTLRPLDTEECEALWGTVSGKPTTTRAVRPLEILTGGNPRLIAIIARFGAGQSFPELMSNLLDLVDEHTEYFKSHLEALPPQERRVYLALARLWRPSTTREVADLARLDTNKCSAMLRRLAQRGTVAIDGGTPRRKEYYLTERLYNIYYLLRRGGGEDRLVKVLIDFMVCLYSPSELLTFTKEIYDASQPSQMLLEGVQVHMTVALTKEAITLHHMGRTNEALDVYDELMRLSNSSGISSTQFVVATTLLQEFISLIGADQEDASLAMCNELAGRFETREDPQSRLVTAVAFYAKGIVSFERKDFTKSLSNYDRALRDLNGLVENWPAKFLTGGLIYCKGMTYMQNGHQDKALVAYDKVVALCANSEQPVFAPLKANALAAKVIALDVVNQTISDSEFSLLLKSMFEGSKLSNRCLDAIVIHAARVQPARAIELIQASPAAQQLLPLLTALQQELGLTTHVAKEIEEVAADIRRVMTKLKNRDSSGRQV